MSHTPESTKEAINNTKQDHVDPQKEQNIPIPAVSRNQDNQKKFPFGLRIIESYLRHTPQPYKSTNLD